MQISEETKVIKVYESFRLGYCKCGCRKEIGIKYEHKNFLRLYLKGHHRRGPKGPNKVSWIGKRTFDEYWYLYLPDYFSSNSKGKVLEHVYFYQEYYQCCMLPWGIVHHKDFNKENNMIWNLQGMTNKQHQNLHHEKDMSGRRCSKCNTDRTYIKRNGKPMWYGKITSLCKECYDQSKYVKKERKKKDWTGTTCYLCGSDKTTMTYRGNYDWRKYKNRVICSKCYKREYRKRRI